MIKIRAYRMIVRYRERRRVLNWILNATIVIIGAYAILPIILLDNNYIFTIHDNLDHYAAYIQYIHDNNLFFKFFDNYPIMGGIPGYYFLSYVSYGLSGLLGWIFGYRLSQVIIRVIGVILGYFSIKYFFNQISERRDNKLNSVLRILAIIYAVTPISPIRALSFAIMPFIPGLFILLSREKGFRKLSFLTFVFPFFSYFNSLTLFAIVFWGVGCVIDWIRNKTPNPNLFISLVFYIIGTVIFDFPIIYLVLHSSETNRALHFAPSDFNSNRFRELLRFGQYHASSYHHYILMWCVCIGVIYLSWKFILLRKRRSKQSYINGKAILLLWIGLVAWIIAAFIQAYSETNRKTGILLIDGFQWGRIIGWGRFLWLAMFVVVVYTAFVSFNVTRPQLTGERLIFYGVRLALGVALFGGLYFFFNLVFGDMGFPNSWSSFFPENIRRIVNIFHWVAVGLFIFGLFCENKRVFIIGICFVAFSQGAFVLTTKDSYSENARSIYYSITNTKDNESITFGEFYDKELFEQIKTDIHYSDEGVAAYGLQPAVLLFNGFRTIDGYLSIHPMKNQDEFRKIIAPYLERNVFYQNYFDNWGGRMYLYGDLSFDPIRTKEREPSELLIDTDAFKAYGGRYIFSGASILNADDLHLTLINDYTRPESIYHVYLYQVE